MASPRWHLEVNFKTDEDKPTGDARLVHSLGRLSLDRRHEIRPALHRFARGIAAALSTPTRSTCSTCASPHTNPLIAAAAKVAAQPASTSPAKLLWQLAWQATGDTSYLEKVYASQIQTAHEREFINTEGSLWIDRIYFNNGELQRSRLGGVALMRNYCYPGQRRQLALRCAGQ